MQITLGIDYGDTHAASSLVQRLRFRGAALDFTHVIPSSLWSPPKSASLIPAEVLLSDSDVEELTRQEDGDAAKLLASATADCAAAGQDFKTTILRGNATATLMTHADATQADLIAVNASRENALMAMLTGSVARGLVIGAQQSVLLARPSRISPNPERPFRAVLATDHSAYMDRCVDKLLGFLPQGLDHLTILTAFPEKNIQPVRSRLPRLAVDPGEAIRHELQTRNDALAKRFRESPMGSSTTVSAQISGESIDHAILLAMQDTEADLLIVGAQGHSLLERLTIGSVSFRQAMTEPYSVLILRLAPAEIEAIRGSD